VDDIIKAARNVFEWREKDIKKHAKIYKWKRIVEDIVKDYGTR